MWNRLKRNIPEGSIKGRPDNTECVMHMKTGHVIRVVGLDDPDALRGSGLWLFLGDEWTDAKPVSCPTSSCPCSPCLPARPKGFAALYKGYRSGQPSCLHPDVGAPGGPTSPILNCFEPKACTTGTSPQVCRKHTRVLHSASQ